LQYEKSLPNSPGLKLVAYESLMKFLKKNKPELNAQAFILVAGTGFEPVSASWLI